MDSTESQRKNLLQLLLGTKLVGVPALLLPAVQGTRVEASIADPADHLVAVVLGGEQAEGGLDHAAAQPQHQVEGALLLDVVVGEGPPILELLPSKDQPLLIRGNPLLVLDLGLDILNRVRWLDLQGDGLARQGLHEDLHDF